MSARNLWIVAGMLAFGVAIGVWMYTRGSGSRRGSAEVAGSASSSPGLPGSDPGHPATLEPHRTIPVPPIGPGTAASSAEPAPEPAGTPLATAFDDEQRDDGWAGSTEATLRPRLSAIADKTQTALAVECRTRQCRVTIEGPSEGASTALTRLGEDGGLYGVATQMIASAPVTLPDGRMRVVVYGQFDR